jgi:hypothetical protein
VTAVVLSRRKARPARVLRIEIRRSVVPWAIPLLVALFLADTYRTAAGLPPVWTVRSSVITNNMLVDFLPFAAGLAAWVGSREGRRKTRDVLTTTVRPALLRQAAALGATLFWLLLVFLAGVVVLYVATALQATWGGPPLWPVAVGAVGVLTVTVVGFTAGALFPSRFTAPLAAIGVVLLSLVGDHAALNVGPGTSTYALLSPIAGMPLSDDGVLYHAAPDVAIAQVMFMGGVSVALLGLLALAPVSRVPCRGLLSAVGRTGRWLCAIGVGLLVAGVAASSTAYALAGTARLGVSGWDIPALHDAASDQPVPYTPECAGTSFKVCVHPAFGAYLDDANAALQPVAAEIAGLPGAPVRTALVAAGDGVQSGGASYTPQPMPYIAGTPPVFSYTYYTFLSPPWNDPAIPNDVHDGPWNSSLQQQLLTAFVAQSASSSSILGPAQQAVIVALMGAVGSHVHVFPGGDGVKVGGPSAMQITVAGQRFGSLAPAARHAWLVTHLAALRAGTITLAQLP